MYTETVISYFGSRNKLAKALGIRRQAIQAWGSIIPMGRAYQLENITDGKLKVKPKLYTKPNGAK